MTSRKRVLIALHRFEVGGAENQALYLAEYLKSKGFEVIVGAFGNETGLGVNRFLDAGIKTVYWGFQEKLLLDSKPGLKSQLIKIKFLFKLINAVRNLSPNVILTFTYPPNVIFGKWKKWLGGVDIYWNQRDINIGFKGHSWEKSAIKNADFLISNSFEGAKYIEKISKKKVHIIPNYVNVNKFGQSIHPNQIESLKVLMIGNIHSQKNHIQLLKDWKDVLEVNPKAKLLLAGKFGNEYEKCSIFTKENNMESSVVFLGQVKDVPSLIQKCHLAVFYSHGEGMPNGILEPMACGLPVLVHRESWSELVLGKDYNFFLSNEKGEKLADRIVELVGKIELLVEIGKLNRKRVSDNFEIKYTLNKYYILINSNALH